MIDSRMQHESVMASDHKKTSVNRNSSRSNLINAFPSSPTLETPSMFSSSSTLSNTSLFLYGRFRSQSLGKNDPQSLPSSTSSSCISSHRQNESSSNQTSKSNLLTIPSAPVLNDFEPKYRIGKDSSKDLYSIAQDINLNRCLPRWPIECQVIRKKVQHIRSFPTEPEVFYEVSGKEAQPRPLGEDHGAVVFEYNVTSSVSYFSRSVAAPTADSPSEYPSDLPKLPNTLRFESRFESGNLAKAIRITESYYELYLRPDLYTSRHCQWFYFQVKNMRADMTYRFSIVNFNKPDSLYTCGMRPVLYSELEAEKHYVGWSRVGSNIRYYRNEAYDEDEGCGVKTLNGGAGLYKKPLHIMNHCNMDGYVRGQKSTFWNDLQDDLGAIQENESRAKVCSQKLLCNSLAGNNVYILTITAPAHQEVLKQRSVIFLSARVHPGESPSSWIMRGILHFLTGESQVAEDLRQRFIFKIVPMINPDGVIVGNTRCSLTGRDLNRQYKSVIKEAFPPVFHLKAIFRRLMEEHGIVFYCDLHAHSRRFNVFLYGCENRRHSEKFLKEQVFPLMLHKNTSEKFSFDDCRFRIQRQKESTGRVVFWNMGITCSYTMEASYGGTNLGSRAYTHFNTDDYEGIGRYFCETLQDFLSPCPINEQLRLKIVSRLVKDGSTADEPSNIALTDYSSLSSADLSSTCDEEDTHCQQLKKNRRLRSRRERAKNMAQMSKTLDLRKVASYVHFGSPNPFLKKSGSDRALDEKASSKGKKNERRKFKRSLTMASIPTALLQPPRSDTGPTLPDRPLSPRVMELRQSEGPETKFTIGTSDESEDDDANEDDLQKLFCPLTDSLGSPFEYQGTKSEQLSASSCRRVQSEILASVSKIKLLGQGRGLLSSHNSSSHIGQGDSSDGESSRCLTPIKIVATLPDGLNQISMGKKKIPSISVSIPSSAAQETKPEKKKKSGKKSWEKYNRMRKACKVLEKSGEGGQPSVAKTEVTEVKTLLATVNMTPTTVVKIKKRKKKKSVASGTNK